MNFPLCCTQNSSQHLGASYLCSQVICSELTALQHFRHSLKKRNCQSERWKFREKIPCVVEQAHLYPLLPDNCFHVVFKQRIVEGYLTKKHIMRYLDLPKNQWPKTHKHVELLGVFQNHFRQGLMNLHLSTGRQRPQKWTNARDQTQPSIFRAYVSSQGWYIYGIFVIYSND